MNIVIVLIHIKLLLEKELLRQYLKLRKSINGVLSNHRENILLWLQKYYIYYKFKRDDVFVQSILYLHFCICFIGHEIEKKKLKK